MTVYLAQEGRFMLLFCFAEASAAKFRHAILFLHLFGDQPRRSILDRKNTRKLSVSLEAKYLVICVCT